MDRFGDFRLRVEAVGKEEGRAGRKIAGFLCMVKKSVKLKGMALPANKVYFSHLFSLNTELSLQDLYVLSAQADIRSYVRANGCHPPEPWKPDCMQAQWTITRVFFSAYI